MLIKYFEIARWNMLYFTYLEVLFLHFSLFQYYFIISAIEPGIFDSLNRIGTPSFSVPCIKAMILCSHGSLWSRGLYMYLLVMENELELHYYYRNLLYLTMNLSNQNGHTFPCHSSCTACKATQWGLFFAEMLGFNYMRVRRNWDLKKKVANWSQWEDSGCCQYAKDQIVSQQQAAEQSLGEN